MLPLGLEDQTYQNATNGAPFSAQAAAGLLPAVFTAPAPQMSSNGDNTGPIADVNPPIQTVTAVSGFTVMSHCLERLQNIYQFPVEILQQYPATLFLTARRQIRSSIYIWTSTVLRTRNHFEVKVVRHSQAQVSISGISKLASSRPTFIRNILIRKP